MKTLVLIDSHALVHRAFHALPPTMSSSQGVLTNAVYGFTAVLLKMIRELKPDFIAAAFDVAGPTFRHEEFSEYKGTRTRAPEEFYLQIPLVQQVLHAFGIPTFEKSGYEADDIIGSLVRKAKRNKDLQVVIVTGDLDTLQLVDGKRVNVFTLRKGVTDTIIYDEKAVMERFGLRPEQVVDFKGLRGDPSDNIPGVLGIGEKTASALVREFGSIENIYKAIAAGPSKRMKKSSVLTEKLIEKLAANKEKAVFSKHLATIKTDLDIDFSLSDADWRAHLDRQLIEKTFKDFGFYSLLKRLDGAGTAVDSEQKAAQPQTVGALRAEQNGLLVAHNAKPYLKELLAAGRELPAEIFDTKIAAYLVRPDGRAYEFEQLAHECGVVGENIGGQLIDLKKKLEDKLKDAGLMHVFQDIEMPLIKVLARMELDGVMVNREVIDVLRKKAAKEAQRLEKKIYDLAGTTFNINSPQQLGQVLFENLGIKGRIRRTGGGALSTAAPELEKIRDEHPIIGQILTYREIEKLLTTYIEPFPELIAQDGRVHTNYNQTGTSTGRLASENPNLQNIPVKTDLGNEFRRAFVAPSGWTLVSFDYSQLELRIVAHIANDKKMTSAFRRGDDIHTRTAAEILDVEPEEVTKEMRRLAKVLNFGMIYGMGSLGFARAAGVDRERAKNFIERYFEEFRGVASYMEETKKAVYKNGYVQTIFGRRRYLPDARSTMPQLRAQAERMAINHPVQGTGADIVKMAMIAVYDFLEREKLRDKMHLLLQVHDEIVFEVRQDAVSSVVSAVRNILENVHALKVPLAVDVRAGANWSDMELLKT